MVYCKEKMKHLDGNKCFMELDKLDCARITQYLEMGLKYAKEKDMRSCQPEITKYMHRFKSFYNPITIKEKLERR